jgi:hypothetical protein
VLGQGASSCLGSLRSKGSWATSRCAGWSRARCSSSTCSALVTRAWRRLCVAGQSERRSRLRTVSVGKSASARGFQGGFCARLSMNCSRLTKTKRPRTHASVTAVPARCVFCITRLVHVHAAFSSARFGDCAISTKGVYSCPDRTHAVPSAPVLPPPVNSSPRNSAATLPALSSHFISWTTGPGATRTNTQCRRLPPQPPVRTCPACCVHLCTFKDGRAGFSRGEVHLRTPRR